jgi:hypothetical protein
VEYGNQVSHSAIITQFQTHFSSSDTGYCLLFGHRSYLLCAQGLPACVSVWIT